MAQDPARKPPEWFKREKLALIEHLKALDSFSVAANSFQKLVDLGSNADTDIRAALHTTGIIHYARPFLQKARFSEEIIKGDSGYDDAIHTQLLKLRNKLVAHSDPDYADGRLFGKHFTVQNEAGDQFDKVLLGVCVVTHTVHVLEDLELARRYLTHVKAAVAAAHTALAKRSEGFVKAGREFPAKLEAAATAEPRVPINLGPFDLSKVTVMQPAILNPYAVLGKPPLTIGQDGYAYRGLAVQVEVSGEATWRGEDGTDQLSIKWGPAQVNEPPSSS